MKKLTYILLAGLTLAAAAACDKQLEPAQEPEVKAGTPMTLTATIGGPQTKLGFTEEDNVLKGAWSANEKISVITLESTTGSDYKKIKTMDIFTAGEDAEGQRKATFTGTLSDGATDDIRVIYPALTEQYQRTGSTATFYGSPQLKGTDKYENAHYFDKRLIGGGKVGAEYLQIQPTVTLQSTSDGFDHIPDATLLDGVPTLSEDGALKVELRSLSSVVRVEFTLPSSDVGEKIDYLEIAALKGENNNSGDPIPYNFTGRYYYFHKDGIGVETFLDRYSRAFMSMGSTNSPLRIESTKIIAYVPIVPANNGSIWGPSGAKQLKVRIWSLDYPSGQYSRTKTITLTGDTVLEGGKMYRLNVDFTKSN